MVAFCVYLHFAQCSNFLETGLVHRIKRMYFTSNIFSDESILVTHSPVLVALLKTE